MTNEELPDCGLGLCVPFFGSETQVKRHSALKMEKIVPTSLCYFIKKFEIVLQIVQFWYTLRILSVSARWHSFPDREQIITKTIL